MDKTLYIASEIHEHEYENRTDIETVDIMSGVTSIGAYAFAGCTNLRESELPDSLEIIGEFAFKGCISLRNMWIPDPARIEDNAFDGTRFTCFTSVEDHGINSEGIFEIRNGVLMKYNGKETSVTVPDGVKAIGSHAFFLLKFLEEVTLPNGVYMIANSAFFGSALKKIILPDSVRIIGSEAFACCRQLESIVLNDGLTEIGESAFNRCESLKSITIPDSVTEIEEGAFFCCDDLTICGKAGSAAEQCAKENGCRFEAIT